MASLSATLRERTAAAHRRVEGTPFVRALLAGRLDRAGYTLLLRSLHEVYAALEAALGAQPALAPLVHPALPRSEALGEDLVLLHGPRWREELAPRPASIGYARRLGELAAAQPLLLAAHAYVRYLGDLSGGQVLGRIVQRSLGLAGEAGTRFYRFEAPPDSLAQGLRAGLDALVVDAPQREAPLDEALAAFGRHEHLFAELQAMR
ncbi:biliverdin-producing heme oxygenase [Piscinibacter defluvii]|uniref:biliverdin-producing heme oxygenase n=1 Tax=Piscinibacter defluvii TaxID=1796922 RepID=UPI000FDE7D3E|nr:biliverdin-producing heme oxygenase [Piscinibacter defluvii]